MPGSPPSVEGNVNPALDDWEYHDDFAEIDAVLARRAAVLDGSAMPRPAAERDPLVYEADWDEDQRLDQWRSLFIETERLPPVLSAALLLDGWNRIEVLQHRAELGRQLVASLLRRDADASAGAQCWAAQRAARTAPCGKSDDADFGNAQGVSAAAERGMKEDDRILLARQQLDRQVSARSVNSKLSRPVDLVVERPVVSANLIAREFWITPQGARHLAAQLPLTEMTGRGRFRAWGML